MGRVVSARSELTAFLTGTGDTPGAEGDQRGDDDQRGRKGGHEKGTNQVLGTNEPTIGRLRPAEWRTETPERRTKPFALPPKKTRPPIPPLLNRHDAGGSFTLPTHAGPIDSPRHPSAPPTTPTTEQTQLEEEMVGTTVPRFSREHGDEMEVTSGEYLAALRAVFFERKVETDAEKIRVAGLYLKYDSRAMEWYEAGEKGWATKSFNEFRTEFLSKFPMPVRVRKTTTELETELGDMSMKEEEVGEKVKMNGTEVYSHVAFAHKALEIARELGFENRATLVAQVAGKLPKAVRNQVKSEHTTWADFATALRGINIGDLRRDVEEGKMEKRREEEMERRLRMVEQQAARPKTTTTTNQSVDDLTRALSRISMGTPGSTGGGNRNQRQITPQGGVAVAAPVRAFGNLTPVTEEAREAVRASLVRYPKQAPTEEGMRAYIEQLRSWEKANLGKPDFPGESIGYPISPFTVNPGTGECFRCGQTGHRSRDCLERDPKKQLSTREGNWRAVVSRVYRSQTRAQTAQVNFVGESEEDLSWAGDLVAQFLQGKGQGATE